jgi:hypothetical protein
MRQNIINLIKQAKNLCALQPESRDFVPEKIMLKTNTALQSFKGKSL